jgi:hypothetical protein
MTTDRLPPWDPDEYDREVKAARARERRERGPAVKRPVQPNTSTFNYDGLPRGVATPSELRRRATVERAMQSRAERRAGTSADHLSAARSAARAQRPGRVRMPRPKLKPSGRWLARCVQDGVAYGATFDTEAEAQAYLDHITGGTD